MQFDWSAIWPAIPILLEGAKMTLWISVLGLIGGLIIGLVAGLPVPTAVGLPTTSPWYSSKLFAARLSWCR